MTFMQLQVYRAGKLYSADCQKCGCTMFAHEWVSDDPNGDRDAMQDGTLVCQECGGHADPETFCAFPRPQYAARYSAPGYMDCTEWTFGSNRRKLEREVREMYGE